MSPAGPGIGSSATFPFESRDERGPDRFSREERFTRAVEAIREIESLGVGFHSFKEAGLDTPADGRPDLGRDVLRALLL